jgi:hypothetical protein
MPYQPQAPAKKELGPMKGAHLVLNQEVLDFIRESLEVIAEVYSDEIHDSDPASVVNALEELGWGVTEDKFGYKVYNKITYAVNGHETGELRVTAVLKKGKELALDIRVWGEYNR